MFLAFWIWCKHIYNNFKGGMFHCEDEPEEFEWNRLTELQRRNTLCLPHLKTSYPVETQRVKPKDFTDDALRYSIMPNGSGKKRKKEQLSDEDDPKSSMQLRSSKQVNLSFCSCCVTLMKNRFSLSLVSQYHTFIWKKNCVKCFSFSNSFPKDVQRARLIQ